jgi:hypothetical protein
MVSRPVCLGVKLHVGPKTRFCYCQIFAGLLMWGVLSDERTGLLFTIAGGHHQCSYTWVRVPQDSWLYFNVADLRLPQPGLPSPCIYIPQEQASPVIPPSSGFPFCCLLLLAGLRWRYLNPCWLSTNCPACNISAQTTQKTPFLCCYIQLLPWTLVCKAVT